MRKYAQTAAKGPWKGLGPEGVTVTTDRRCRRKLWQSLATWFMVMMRRKAHPKEITGCIPTLWKTYLGHHFSYGTKEVFFPLGRAMQQKRPPKPTNVHRVEEHGCTRKELQPAADTMHLKSHHRGTLLQIAKREHATVAIGNAGLEKTDRPEIPQVGPRQSPVKRQQSMLHWKRYTTFTPSVEKLEE